MSDSGVVDVITISLEIGYILKNALRNVVINPLESILQLMKRNLLSNSGSYKGNLTG